MRNSPPPSASTPSMCRTWTRCPRCRRRVAEETAQILDVRLARGVADARPSLGEDGGHDGALRARDRRLVQVEPLPAEPVGPHLVRAVQLNFDPELLERVDVGVEAAAPDHVAARRRHGDLAEPRQQRRGEEERRADVAREVRVEARLRDAGRVDSDVVRPGPLDVGAEIAHELDHRLDVADPRDVREPYFTGGHDARREDRQCAVLVARGADRPAERATPSITKDSMARGIVEAEAIDAPQSRSWTVTGGARSSVWACRRLERSRGSARRRRARSRAPRRSTRPS